MGDGISPTSSSIPGLKGTRDFKVKPACREELWGEYAPGPGTACPTPILIDGLPPKLKAGPSAFFCDPVTEGEYAPGPGARSMAASAR